MMLAYTTEIDRKRNTDVLFLLHLPPPFQCSPLSFRFTRNPSIMNEDDHDDNKRRQRRQRERDWEEQKAQVQREHSQTNMTLLPVVQMVCPAACFTALLPLPPLISFLAFGEEHTHKQSTEQLLCHANKRRRRRRRRKRKRTMHHWCKSRLAVRRNDLFSLYDTQHNSESLC